MKDGNQAAEGDARIAVLVMGHANPAVFGRLTGALDHPRIRIFAHLDARTALDPFQEQAAADVHFLDKRVVNLWGAWSQVEAALRLMRAARAEGPFTSYVLISGDTLPLVLPEALIAALAATPTMLQFERFGPNHQFHKRVSGIFVGHSTFGRMREKGGWMDQLRLDPRDFDDILAAMRTARAKRNLGFTVFKGSQWMALSQPHLDALFDFFDRDPTYVEIYRYSLIPDESFFHSALKQLFPKLPSRDALMGLHWPQPRGPSPLTLRLPDELPIVTETRTLFFRKFADDGLELADAVLAARRDAAMVQADSQPMADARGATA
jgi:hypothetical protein